MRADGCLFRGATLGSCTVCTSLIEEIQLTNYTASAGEPKVTKVWDQVRAGLSNGGARRRRGAFERGADMAVGWDSRVQPAEVRVNNGRKAGPVVQVVLLAPSKNVQGEHEVLLVRFWHKAASHPSWWGHDSKEWFGKHKWIMVCQPSHYSTNITKNLACVGQKLRQGNPSKNPYNS